MVPHLTSPLHRDAFNVDHFSEDEALLASQPLSTVLRHAQARAALDEEECIAVQSTRPTVALHAIAPWR
jgi:hypothetical protein